jgi:hypothetical protein
MTSLVQRLILWRWLSLILFAALAICSIVVWPLTYANSVARDRDGYDRAIERDFANSECLSYQTAPFETLKVPTYGHACWHIYMSRGPKSAVPFTLEAYRARNAVWDRDRHLKALGFGAALTAIFGALVFVLGRFLASGRASAFKNIYDGVRASAKHGAPIDWIGWIIFRVIVWLAVVWSLWFAAVWFLGIPSAFLPRENIMVSYWAGTIGLLLIGWAIFAWLRRRASAGHSPLITSSDA